jgi:hypothetical protein
MLLFKGQTDEAIRLWQKASTLDPKDAFNHYNLGKVLAMQGRHDEAIASYRKGIELNPKRFDPHLSLGILLLNVYRPDEALEVLQKAVALNPKAAPAHHMLGTAFLRVGRYDEAKEPLERALVLFPKLHPAREEVSGLLQAGVRYQKLEQRLPRLISGEEKPASAQEAQDAGQICWYRNLTYAAARLRAAAFALDPRTADDLKAGHRFSAACEAALAAAGQGKDADKLDAKERARLRKQALDWLRADLTAWAKRLKSGERADRAAVLRMMKHWQQDKDFVGIRDEEALAKLPAEERKAFTQLWADVAALRKQAEMPPAQEGKK